MTSLLTLNDSEACNELPRYVINYHHPTDSVIADVGINIKCHQTEQLIAKVSHAGALKNREPSEAVQRNVVDSSADMTNGRHIKTYVDKYATFCISHGPVNCWTLCSSKHSIIDFLTD